MSRQRSAFTVIKVLVVTANIALLTGLVAVVLYGGMRGTGMPSPSQPIAPSESLSDEDRQLIEKQKICLVSGQPLDSMGDPYRFEVEGKTVFVCCKGCTSALRKDPAKYLEKLK
jgi:YHS domain-containing protein